MNLPSNNYDATTAKNSTESRAFTLVELLVVIAIIGILAGLLIPLAGVATAKMRLSRVQAELNSYVNAIETYKLETGEYPPDNGLIRNLSSNDWGNYLSNAAINPLVYELQGAIFTNANNVPSYITPAQGEVIKAADLERYFNVTGLRNSARVKNDIDYKGTTLKKAQSEKISKGRHGVGAEVDLAVLAVPVPGPYTLESADGKKRINPWFYDASSTNRHNKNSFDLWATILVGNNINVIANWKN